MNSASGSSAEFLVFRRGHVPRSAQPELEAKDGEVSPL